MVPSINDRRRFSLMPRLYRARRQPAEMLDVQPAHERPSEKGSDGPGVIYNAVKPLTEPQTVANPDESAEKSLADFVLGSVHDFDFKHGAGRVDVSLDRVDGILSVVARGEDCGAAQAGERLVAVQWMRPG